MSLLEVVKTIAARILSTMIDEERLKVRSFVESQLKDLGISGLWRGVVLTVLDAVFLKAVELSALPAHETAAGERALADLLLKAAAEIQVRQIRQGGTTMHRTQTTWILPPQWQPPAVDAL